MIKRLRIKNFQKHKSLDIEFDENITSIVGASDVGKSALIRALKWVCFNKPNGTDFIRKGTKKCSVRVEVDEHKITRSRGSENTYHLDKEVFHAFGNNVPKEIEDVLGVNEINFQGQHDSPFWLNESPGQVSRNLNQIVNLGVIDSTLSSIGRNLKQAKWRSEETKERYQKAKETKQALSWVVVASNDLDVIEYKEQVLESTAGALNRLSSLVDAVDGVGDIKTLHEFQKELKSRIEITKAKIDHENRLEQLTELFDQIGKEKKQIKDAQKLKTKISNEMKGFQQCPLCHQTMTT